MRQSQNLKQGLLAFFLVLTTSFLSVTSLQAQQNKEDSASYRLAIANTRDIYFQQLGDQSPLFNGAYYPEYAFAFLAGSPYFLTSELNNGTIVYAGIRFSDVPLLYDDLREILVTKVGSFHVQMVNDRIEDFTLLGHHFIRMVTDSLRGNRLRTGFYELLYSGNTQVLKKEVKTIKEDLSVVDGVLRSVLVSTRYYLRIRGNYYRIESKRGLLDVLKDHKKEIQLFLRKNKLRYRKDQENTLIKVAAYYDQLTK